jgi:antitoxin Phd
MPKRVWSVQDAKNRFSEVVNAAQRAPQTVTRHGNPAVVILNAAEFERLQELQRARAPSLTDLLLEMPQDDEEFPRARVADRDVGL